MYTIRHSPHRFRYAENRGEQFFGHAPMGPAHRISFLGPAERKGGHVETRRFPRRTRKRQKSAPEVPVFIPEGREMRIYCIDRKRIVSCRLRLTRECVQI